MEEVLSQNEIDALLSAITSGEMDAEELKNEEKEKKVRVYDFKRALRFSKDQIRSISRIHENYARLLTTFFSTQLRTYVNISVTSVDQVPYEEFIRSVPKITVLNIYSVPPLDGRMIIEVNPNIAYALLDRILGGKGNTINKTDNLTEIEKLLLTQIFEKGIYCLKEAWSTVTDIDPILEEFEENPQFIQMVSPNETVVVVSLTTAIGEASGVMNICIPHVILEPIITKLSAHYWMQTSEKERNPESYDKLSNHLTRAEVDIKAILGESSISIQEFLDLNNGDVIGLNQSIDEPLTMLINDIPKFHVQPGTYKNKISAQILEGIKGVTDNDE
ncbi:flagellar motor switch protein FliM [Oceanobacillus piezotolerans]|uniref:Flagellar motor switch protein FliM n=1 Tax=Oceanobacillus piezotolerans TaxID=2448030 RepID=A0A498DIK0_9BACI|nr:flagellar motor switch protein FliM [Oceanobacillus piezotolerans]RLL45325.1 flagellar motor switch protein FliM [Oceanobacillus piezotolerans]